MRLTTEQFIEKARSIHGDRYGYSLVDYKNNKTKVKIICSVHGIFLKLPRNHLTGQGCPICAKYERRQTNLERYGAENLFQSKEIQDKIRQTNLERYGVNWLFQSKEIQDKIKQTNLERYGVECPLLNQKVQDKRRQTNLERYGAENLFQSKEIQDKRKRNNIEKYGVEFTRQKNYTKETLLKLNSFEYLYNEYINRDRTIIQIGKELIIDPTTVWNYLRKHNIPILKIAKFSKISIQWLNSIMEEEGIYIQHAGNEGEYNIPGTRLLVDGYCKDSRTVYEFYGDCWHGNPNLYKEEDRPHPFNLNITTIELHNKTMEREKRIRELGYRVETIWENDWAAF